MAGVDGRYNEGARKALNFLLYGSSGYEISQSSKGDADLADGLLLVSAKMCFLHVGSSATYWKLLPLLGPVADLQLSAPTEDEEQDLDLLEERKILCFLEAISNLKTVGVDLGGKQPMELEQWPLIQVYGIEELGGRGFFTMRHQVVDVGPALESIYQRLDAQAAQTLVTYHVDLLAFHWLTSLACLDKAGVYDRLRVSEAALIDPMASLFSYGLLRQANQKDKERFRPRASFGIRTNLVDDSSSASATVSNSGVGGKPATHFVVEAAEPNGPIRIARTYFFSNGGAGARVLTFDYDGMETQEDDNKLERGGRSAYARCLMMAYCAVVHVHKKLVRAFCLGQATDHPSLTALAVTWIHELQLDWFRNYDVDANIELEISGRDLAGNPGDAALGSRHVKYLKLALRHISSLDQTPVDLGSVVFGETFFDPPSKSHDALVLTEKIEPLCGWLAEGQEEDTENMSSLISRLTFNDRNRHYTMGALMRAEPIPGVRMLTGLPEIPTVKGQLWVFERGLIFSCARLGSIALDFKKHVASLSHFNSAAQSRADHSTAVVVFQLKDSLQRYGIIEATISLPSPTFVISTGEADRRELTRDVLPDWLAWFKTQELDTTELDAMPAGFSDSEALSSMRWGAQPLSVHTVTDPKIDSYLSTLQALDAKRHSGKAPESNPAMQRPQVTDSCRLVVCLGEPGCDKTKLMQGAMQLAGLAASWKLAAYRNPRSSVHLDADDLAASILDVVPSVSDGGGIVLIVSSGASAAAVAAAVLDNAKLQSKIYLERMLAVVNATSMLCPGNLAHEANVAAQCTAGLVSSIVLVNIEAMGDQVEDMQKRLRCINPLAPVIRAVAGRVTVARDLESLFHLAANDQAWFERERVRGMRQLLLTSAAQTRSDDAWSSRRGPLLQAHIPLPREVIFVRPHLVRAIRALFVSPRETLGRYVEEERSRNVTMMELSHVSAIVNMVQSDRPEDAGNMQMYIVKAKRGIVTFTKCAGDLAQAQAAMRVSGRNLNAEKLVTSFFQGRKPIPELKKERDANDITKEERNKILQGVENYPLPEGVFFNGSKYVNWEGETLKEHPCMPQMIEDFLKNELVEVARCNQEIKEMQAAYERELASCLATAVKAVSQGS